MKRDGVAPKRNAKIAIPFMMKTQLIEKYQEIDLLLKQIPYVGEYAWYIILALAVLIFALLVKSIMRRKKPTAKPPPAEKVVTEAVVEAEAEEEEEIDQTSIVKFFLKLYKVQLGEPKSVPSEFRPLDLEPSASKTTYELRVHRKKDWESRRMTVGLAGEESASRSKC